MESATDALHEPFEPSLEFGPFRVTPGKRLLSRDGEPVEIGGRVAGGAHRRQLDRQRHAVQAPAHVGDQLGVALLQRQRGVAGLRPFDEQPHRRECQQLLQAQPLAVGGKAQRPQPVHLLAAHPQRLAAGGQQRDAGRGLADALGDGGHRIHQVLAVVDDQQQPLPAQVGEQHEQRVLDLHGNAQRGGQGGRHQRRILDLRQVDEAHRLQALAGGAVAHLDGEAGLADAAGADDGEQPRLRQTLQHQGHVGLAAEQPGPRRQAAHAFAERRHGGGRRRYVQGRAPVHRGDEGIADADLGGDVACPLLAVAEGAAQAVHVKAQAALFHHHVGPDALDQLALGQHLARLLQQGDEQVEGAVKATHALLGERFSLGWAGWRTAQPRHQTLRAMLDWSYDLLSPPQRLVFDRLAVFVGPFSLQAASQIVADARIDELEAAATLDELAAKGLVTVDRSETTVTYRLLEMTRAYVRDKLPAHGAAEMHSLGFRHALFYLKLLEGLGSSPEDIFDGCARLASQLGNIRSALEWSFGPQGDPGLALPLAAASAPLFLHFSLQVECRTWCARATELLELGYHGTPTEMELQAALGLVLMFTRGNSGAAETALLRALDIAVALDDRWAQLRLLGRLQIFYERIGDFASSLAWAERALAIGDSLGEPEAIAVAASLAGISHHLLGDQRLARQELERSLRNSLPSERSRTLHYGFDHHNRTGLALARTLWLLGFPDQARRLATQVEAEAAELKHPATYCIALVWTLCIHIWNGDLAQAEASLQAFSQIAHANAFAPYMAASQGLRGAIAIRREQPGDAVPLLEESLSRLQGMRYELLTTSFEISLAEGLILDGQYARALAVIQRSVQHCRRSGDAFALPELLRLQAQVLKALGEGATAVDAVLDESLALARQQGARAWELRAGMDRAKLHLEQGRNTEAAQLLDACALSEGFDSLDMRQLAQLRQRLG